MSSDSSSIILPPELDDFTGKCVNVALQDRSYVITIGSGERNRIGAWARSWIERFPHWKTDHPKGLVVSDTHVAKLYADSIVAALNDAGWTVDLKIVPAGEKSKSQQVLGTIYDQLVDFQADRRTAVIALGGGVVGDLAGFAAASYNRGIPLIQIPTTLLAAVDSSVGGKTGINHPKGKNLIGAFHQPLGVMIDPEVMKSLPERDYRSGLAEVVKYGMILDSEFFDYLEQNAAAILKRDSEHLERIIQRSCELKAYVVQEDEFERTGLRAVLNYGHTFAHAYEALCGYGELMHGEAVSLGMHDAAQLAQSMGMISEEIVNRQQKLLDALGLPTSLDFEPTFTVDQMIECMKVDKKTVGGKLRFILPEKIGKVVMVSDVSEQDVRQILAHIG